MTRFENSIDAARRQLSNFSELLGSWRRGPEVRNELALLAAAANCIVEAVETIADGTANDPFETAGESLRRAELEAEAQAASGVPEDEARAFVDVARSTTPAFSDNSGYANAATSKTPLSTIPTRVDNFEAALRDRFGDRLGVDGREIAIFAVDWFRRAELALDEGPWMT